MKILKDIVILIALAGVAFTLWWTPFMIRAELQATRVATLQEVRHATDTVVPMVSGRVDGAVGVIAGKLDRQMTALRADATGQLDTLRDETVAQVAVARTEILNRADAAAKSISPTVTSVNSITAHVADALPAYTDCYYLDPLTGEVAGGNPDCAFNRFQGTSKAIERMAEAGAKAAPQVAGSVAEISQQGAGIARDVHTATTQFVKPKTFWGRFKEFFVLGAKASSYFF